jgi:hypothetical protein
MRWDRAAVRWSRPDGDHRIKRDGVCLRGRKASWLTARCGASVFTTAVVEGLETGEADGNQDGQVDWMSCMSMSGTRWGAATDLVLLPGWHRFTGLGLRQAVDLLVLASAGGLVLPR